MLFEILKNIVGIMGLLLSLGILPMIPFLVDSDRDHVESRVTTVYFTFVFIWFVLAMLLAGWALGEYVNFETQSVTHEFWRNR
jgi:hypothetical protein